MAGKARRTLTSEAKSRRDTCVFLVVVWGGGGGGAGGVGVPPLRRETRVCGVRVCGVGALEQSPPLPLIVSLVGSLCVFL